MVRGISKYCKVYKGRINIRSRQKNKSLKLLPGFCSFCDVECYSATGASGASASGVATSSAASAT